MNSSNTPAPRPTRAELAAQLSEELIRLRDALVSLSINLKDWQFETDQNGRRISQQLAAQALDKFKLPPAPTGAKNLISRSQESEGS